MREQPMTVSGMYQPGWHPLPSRASQVPLLILAGPWLEEVGFAAGSEVRVLAEPGRVVVELRELRRGSRGEEV